MTVGELSCDQIMLPRIWLPLDDVPSLNTLSPLPEGLLGLTTTSMDWMRSPFRCCSSRRACRDVQLNWSEPQKRILRGSDLFEAVLYDSRHGTDLMGVRSEDRASRVRSISIEIVVEGTSPLHAAQMAYYAETLIRRLKKTEILIF